MDIRKLILEDVRCFAGRQDFDIRPLTFLVGENSTGKTTALGCLHTAHEFICGRRSGLDFNVNPYQMGTFSEIVRRSNPKLDRFLIGCELQADADSESIEYSLTLAAKERGSEPVIREQKIISDYGEALFYWNNQNADRQNHLEIVHGVEIVEYIKGADSGKFKVRVSEASWFDSTLLELFPAPTFDDMFTAHDTPRKSIPREVKAFKEFKKNTMKHFDQEWDHLYENAGFGQPEMYSFAPIRSSPQRTYNPLREDVSPEGSDIPMVLMNISRTDKKSWEKLRDRLIKFGRSSGLFTDIHVRSLGRSSGDPFQLQVKVKGPRANLIDVGYGVNQVLPILVRILNGRRRAIFLMQQPEVHLHPMGQAELSSLLIETIKREKHKYVIETHSDAMINRARIEIMNGGIAPEDVSLIYLEPVGNKVRVHNIQFDEQANLSGVPQGYRDFFINESDRLLGLSK